MRWIGYREFDVSKLHLPGEIAKRMKEPRVEALAASTDELGGEPMQAPTVNADINPPVLVAGRDRMAATLLRKRKKVWCHVGVEWTPLELIKAEIHENLHRRPEDRDALRAELVNRTAALLPLKPSGNATGKSGRPETAKGEARRMVAEAEGVSDEAIRHSETRASKKRDEGEAGSRAPGGLAAPPPPPIDLHGQAMPDHMLDVTGLVEQYDKVDQLLRKAQAAATDLGMFGSAAPGIVESIKRELHDVAVRVRSEKPAHLCPKCDGKSHPQTGPFCKLCQERGWVTATQYTASPKKHASAEEFLRDLEHRASEHAAGLDAPTADIDRHIARAAAAKAPARAKSSRIPPIKAGVTYTVNDDGDVVEQGPAKTPGEAMRRARSKTAVIVDGEALTLEELEARAEATPL